MRVCAFFCIADPDEMVWAAQARPEPAARVAFPGHADGRMFLISWSVGIVRDYPTLYCRPLFLVIGRLRAALSVIAGTPVPPMEVEMPG